MKKKYLIELICLSFLLIGIWAALAFTVEESLIPRFSLWFTLIIGTATGIISFSALYLSVIVFKKDLEEKKESKEEEARLFIHDNNDEIDYLPYCVYASCYDRHGHHTRNIYNNFCRLSDEQQIEVLKAANYKMKLINGKDWVIDKLELINNFAKEYGFGETFLYDSGKHFLNGYCTKEEPYIFDNKEIYKDCFGMYNFMVRISRNKGITLDQYFSSYAYRRFRDPKWLERYNNYVPPGDVLVESKELRDAEKTSSATVAYWMTHMIENIYVAIEEYFYGKEPEGIINNDAEPEYFEDKFYMILNLLHCMDDYSKYQLIKKEPYDKKERDEVEKYAESKQNKNRKEGLK